MHYRNPVGKLRRTHHRREEADGILNLSLALLRLSGSLEKKSLR